MTTRRNLLLGGVCLAGAGAGFALKPHRRTSLLGTASLADIVPTTFAGWTSRDVSDLVAPATDGSLLSKLYAQTVERIYQKNAAGPEIMMLLAYGMTQSNDLQLHRPEVCYLAFGFHLADNAATTLALGPHTDIPARQLIATAHDRQETIVYWTRMGEYLPDSGSQQRLDRMKLALHGVVADGVLARFSVAGDDPSAPSVVREFIPGLIGAMRPSNRPALIGSAASVSLERTVAEVVRKTMV